MVLEGNTWCWKETLWCVTAGATCDAGQTLGLCASPPSRNAAPWGKLFSCILPRFEEWSRAERGKLGQEKFLSEPGTHPVAAGWDSSCAGGAVGSTGILCWQRWAARPTHSLALSITRVLAAFGDFRTSCGSWYPWRRSPKPLSSPRHPLFVSFKQKRGETRVFSEGRWTHSQICCRAQMLHPWTTGKHGFSTCWSHQLMFVQLAANTSPCCCLEQG